MGRPPKTPILPNELHIKTVECGKCREHKTANNFRIRVDKRIKTKRGNDLVYLSNVCLPCEAKAQRERYQRNKNTQAYREKANKLAREFHQRNRERILPKMKEYRNRLEYKDNRKKYNQEHRGIIAAQSRLRNKVYLKSIITQIKPAYARRLKATSKYKSESEKDKLVNDNNATLTENEIRLRVAKHRISKIVKKSK